MMKAVELLGLPGSVNHEPYGQPYEGKPVLIVRDPRNVIVSWLRFHRDIVTPGKFLARFRRFSDRTLVEEMAAFEGWLDVAHVVRYEDLVASDATLRGIAAYLGVPYIDGAWEALDGQTATWNAQKSDYRDVWTPDVIAAWYAEGGGDLLTRWGY